MDKRFGVGGVVLVVLSAPYRAQATSWADNGVTVESVDHYGSCGCDLTNNQTNVNGLLTQLLPAGSSIFTAGKNYHDGAVYDTDFYDGNVSGVTGYDNHNFDADWASNGSTHGNGIAFYSGHGICDDVSASTCTPGVTNCNSPPAGMSNPGACLPNSPGATLGKCAYFRPRNAVVNWDVPSNAYGGAVNYTNGGVKLGERNTAAWTGYGGNGFTNFVVMDISCPMRHHVIWQELGPAFAGLRTFATLFMTTPTSDTADSPDRGSAFGKQYTANSGASISASWRIALNSVTSGGSHGINGYGCHSIVSAGATSTDAYYYRDTISFLNIRLMTAATGPYGWWADGWTCNYDDSTYGIP